MNNLLTDCFLYGMYLLIFLLASVKIHEYFHLLKYNKETKRFERQEKEELLRFGRNVKTFSHNHIS